MAGRSRTVRAFVFGPFLAWTAGRRWLFASSLALEISAVALIASGRASLPEMNLVNIGLGMAMLAALRLCMVCFAWRQTEEAERRTAIPYIIAALTIALYAAWIIIFGTESWLDALLSFPGPNSLRTNMAAFFDSGVDWMKTNWGVFFDSVTIVLRTVLNGIEGLFIDTPWPIVSSIACLLAWALSGWRAATFVFFSLAYLGLFGFWEKSMATLALVATSVFFCVVFGMPMGILAAKSPRAHSVIDPILDVMQTLPTFVYLIPAVAFFSIGKPPGVIATVIFALPPVTRLTSLGIRQTPCEVVEAAMAYGASPLQLLVKIELPLATPSIRIGINQSIMMSLSMVVVAAMIGAGGLGLDVIRALQHLNTGEGLLAGIAIVLCAMALDRSLRGRS